MTAQNAIERPIDMMAFVIFAYPRTGSNHLCSLLTSEQSIACHYELFHKADIFYSSKVAIPDEFAAQYDRKRRDANPENFLSAVSRLYDGLSGFKIFPGHNETLVKKLAMTPTIKKVILYRQNIFANFASNRVARENDTYVHSDGKEYKRAIFDADEFEIYKKNYVGWYANVADLISNSGSEFFFLPYELLNSPVLYRSCVAWVAGADPKRVLSAKSAHTKAGSTDITERFENSAEAMAFLVENGMSAWRYDQSLSIP